MGPEHMQQYSGHIRVIAYFHAMFKDFYQNWTVGTARKRRRRREEERGGGGWILVWAFPRGVECDRKKRFLLPGDPRNELSASEKPLGPAPVDAGSALPTPVRAVLRTQNGRPEGIVIEVRRTHPGELNSTYVTNSH